MMAREAALRVREPRADARTGHVSDPGGLTAITRGDSVFDLGSLLQNRRWLSDETPFRHTLATNVFVPVFYRALEQEFRELFSRGLAEERDGSRLSRRIRGYDVYSYTFRPDVSGPLAIFASRPWHDMMAGLFDVVATRDIDIAIHHHAVGSRSGWVHNDLNPGWFERRERPDGMNVRDDELCSYTHGDPAKPGVAPTETIRAVAVMFYFANPPWTPGDGGETGLYERASQPVDEPSVRVPPHNNSLVAFECTSQSHHAFIRNRRHPRNCVVMWLHRAKTEALDRWGQGAIVEWKR